VFSSFCFYSFLFNFGQLMWENFVFLVIFDTRDVVYSWSVSLFPPIWGILPNHGYDSFCHLTNVYKNYVLVFILFKFYLIHIDMNLCKYFKIRKCFRKRNGHEVWIYSPGIDRYFCFRYINEEEKRKIETVVCVKDRFWKSWSFLIFDNR